MKKVLIEAELFLRLACHPGRNLRRRDTGQGPLKNQARAEKPGLLDPRFGGFKVFFLSSQEDT